MTAEVQQAPVETPLWTPGKDIEWGKMIEAALDMPGSISSVYQRFYNYSTGNCILLYMQGVREPVNTYNRWKDMGRQVLKGSKAKTIMRPILIKETGDDGLEREKLKGFKYLNCLFPVSATEGDELPPVETPTWDKEKALGGLGITEVKFDDLDGNTQGYSIGNTYAINPVAGYPLKTTFHELGHIVLGHTTQSQQSEYRTHRGVKEFQAESTAFLTMKELDLDEHMDESESRGYIQFWLRDQRPNDVEIRQVFGAVDKILRAGRVDSSEQL
jgi:hypothetical protein